MRPEGEQEGEWEMQVIGIDEDFFATYEIELAAGRNIDLSIAGDSTEAFILNETAARQLGWDDPIGKQFDWLTYRKGRIIGVAKDFHTESFHHRVEPIVLFHWIHMNLMLRISPEGVPETIEHLRKTWQQFLPETPFDFHFVDAGLENDYWNEVHLNDTCTIFAVLAIFVACLGLFGLAAFTAEQSTKEIGIRKTVGATVFDIVKLLSRDFAKLVAIANLLAWPLAYYFMNGWLQKFPYRIEVGADPFALCGLLTLGIALGTVSYQAIRAALADPIDALRNE